MAERDDEISRRYRALAREEPHAATDAAILAASRRAVGSRPRRNWAVPASIAAVLVLGIGVSLRMQLEQPGIETSAPESEYPVPQAAQEAPEPTPAPPAIATAPSPMPDAAKDDRAMQARRADALPAEVRRERAAPAPPQPRAKREAPPQPGAALEAAPAVRPEAPRPQAFVDSPPPAAVASAPAPVPQAAPAPPRPEAAELRSAPAAAATGRREAFAGPAARDTSQAKDPREVELDRIARLRAGGRHEDADKALEEFRRRYPDYRIAPETWERVKPR